MFHSFFQGEQLRLGQNPIFVPPFGHQYVAQNRSNLEALSSMDEMGGSYFIISVLEGLSKYIYIYDFTEPPWNHQQKHQKPIKRSISRPALRSALALSRQLLSRRRVSTSLAATWMMRRGGRIGYQPEELTHGKMRTHDKAGGFYPEHMITKAEILWFRH